MSDESKEAISTTDTSREEKEENKDTSMEQDDAETSQEKDESMEKSEEDDDKKEKDKNDEEDNDDDDEEEESDDEPQVGLLEKPLVLEEGKKRERKKVERMTFQTGEKAHEEIKEGKGRSLGDIPYIEHMLGRTKAEDVKPLHRLLYRRPGSNHDVKKNIRQFSGFPFSKDDVEYDKRTQMLKGKNFTLPMIKRIMDILDIPRNGVKDELVARLMEWLEKPKDSGKKLPQSKRKRKSKGSAGKKKEGKKDKKTEKKKKKETKSKASADDDDDDEDMEDLDDTKASDDEDDADKNDESDEESEQSEEEEAPPKKKAKKATPKPKEKKTKQKTTPKAKPSKTPTKKKATPKKKAKVTNEEVSDVSSDSDEEPLIMKEKSKSAPTNDELKDVVKKMLDNANLEQVTMKTVLKDVFAKYPDFDLTDRKDFIKNTVKQIIS